jgi:hypothetical protein
MRGSGRCMAGLKDWEGQKLTLHGYSFLQRDGRSMTNGKNWKSII